MTSHEGEALALDEKGLAAAIEAATLLTLDGGVAVNEYAEGIVKAYLASRPSQLSALSDELEKVKAASDFNAALKTTWRTRAEMEKVRAERAEAALAEARKALEPFADIADLIDSETEGMSETDELALHFHDYLMASWPVALFRAARRAREAQGGGNV